MYIDAGSRFPVHRKRTHQEEKCLTPNYLDVRPARSAGRMRHHPERQKGPDQFGGLPLQYRNHRRPGGNGTARTQEPLQGSVVSRHGPSCRGELTDQIETSEVHQRVNLLRIPQGAVCSLRRVVMLSLARTIASELKRCSPKAILAEFQLFVSGHGNQAFKVRQGAAPEQEVNSW